jgi:hypothetical protein
MVVDASLQTLVDYVQSCGGKDILTFNSTQECSAARDKIKSQLQHAGVLYQVTAEQFDCELHLKKAGAKNATQTNTLQKAGSNGEKT